MKDRFERGTQLGEYVLLEQIGFGGEAVIWSAWDLRRERVVAIKILLSQGDSDLAQSWVLDEYERQVHLIASLNHPHILSLYEFGSEQDVYYFVMQYGSKGSLGDLLSQGLLPLDEVLLMVYQMALALDYLHMRMIVHRDLKPQNVLLDGSNRLYLSDFGLAKQLSAEIAPTHTGRGTGPYASSEQQTMFGGITAQSDIFSLGIVVYEMLTGELPWNGRENLAVKQFNSDVELPDPQELNPNIPAGVAAALRKMTAKDWRERPSSAMAAYEMLAQACEIVPAENQLGLAQAMAEDELLRQDAQYFLHHFQQDWNPITDKFPASLSHFCLINAAYRRLQSRHIDAIFAESDSRRFMLRGALVHGFDAGVWWRDLPLVDQFEVGVQTILLEGQTAVERGIARLLGEPDEVLTAHTFPPIVKEQLVELVTHGEHGWATQNDALALLERIMKPADLWQDICITQTADTQLAHMTFGSGSLAKRVARLLGIMKSRTAVQLLLDAGLSREQLLATLAEIQNSAGYLPPDVPSRIRFRLQINQLQTRFLDDSEGVSLSRALIGFGLGVLLAVAVLLGLFSRQSLQLRDVLLAPYPVSDIVTIVAVNDESLSRYGRWDAWPRSLHAELVDRLVEMGAGAIVFDFVFDTVTEEDEVLRQAIADAGNVVQPVLGRGDAYRLTPNEMNFAAVIVPQPDLLNASVAVGHTNVLHDVDGYIRQSPAIIESNGTQYLNLALAGIQTFLNPAVADSVPEIENGRLALAGRTIPVGPHSEMIIPFAGPPANDRLQTFRTVSYQDVMDGNVPPEFIQGKLIFVGITATSEPDSYLTPVSQGRPMFGVEILANIAESVWSRRFAQPISVSVQVVILLVLGTVTAVLCIRPWSGLLITSGLIVAYLLFAFWLFDKEGIMLDLFFPTMVIVLSYAVVTAYRLSVEVRRRRKILQMFTTNVSSDIAHETMRAVEAGELNLGGATQVVSVLVADMRGYELFATQHDPVDVMEMMNAYRQLLVKTAFQMDGTITQQEGQQVTVLFNAPLSQEDHLQRAVDTAVAIQQAVAHYHDMLPANDTRQQIRFGVGVYTGQALVGNVGSAERFAYSVLGDTVNLATMLAINAAPNQVLVGESALAQMPSNVTLRPLPALRANGHSDLLTIYEIQHVLLQ